MATLSRQQRVALRTWTPQNLRALWDAARKANPNLPATPPMGFSPNVGGGFTPFAMPDRPPPGTYDPALDAQLAASGRGLGDLTADTGLGNIRSQDDFTLAQGELQRQLDRMMQDARTARTNQHADYERAIGDLTHNYDVLRGSQEQRAAQAGGFGAGGALQQALEKRTANFAHDRAPLDTGEQRAQSEFDLLTGPEGRYQQDFQSRLAALGLGPSRGNEDRANTLSRAGRENTQLGVDIGGQRWYQATQAGYDPPQRPAGEHGTGAKAFRYVRTPRGTRRLLSTGYLMAR